MKSIVFSSKLLAVTTLVVASSLANSQIPDGSYTGRLTCGPLVGGKFQVPDRVDDVVQLVVVGKFVTWSRTTQQYREAAQSTFVNGSMEVDARGAFKPEFGPPRAWRMRGVVTQHGNELRGAVTQNHFAGGKRDCQITALVAPVTAEPATPSAASRSAGDEKEVSLKTPSNIANQQKNSDDHVSKSDGVVSTSRPPVETAKQASPQSKTPESKVQENLGRTPQIVIAPQNQNASPAQLPSLDSTRSQSTAQVAVPAKQAIWDPPTSGTWKCSGVDGRLWRTFEFSSNGTYKYLIAGTDSRGVGTYRWENEMRLIMSDRFAITYQIMAMKDLMPSKKSGWAMVGLGNSLTLCHPG